MGVWRSIWRRHKHVEERQEFLQRLAHYFSPYTPAVGDRYVGRTDLLKQIEAGFHCEGKQTLVCGPTGSGKTSTAYRTCQRLGRDAVRFAITEGTTGEHLLKSLNAVYGHKARFKDLIVNLGLNVEIAEISLEAGFERCEQPVDASAVACKIVTDGRVLILDDCDRLDDSGNRMLADLIKKVSDNANLGKGRMICLVDALNDGSILDYNESARSRTTSVCLPVLEPGEQAAISARGFEKLGISFEDEDLSRIHYHSCGLPRALHLICFHVAERAEPESLTKGFFSGKRVFPNIQKALDAAWGDPNSLVKRWREKALSRIADAESRSGLPVDDLKVIAAVAAAQIQEPFSLNDVRSSLTTIGKKWEDIEKPLSALCEGGLLERRLDPLPNAEIRYSFVRLWERLALRFMPQYDVITRIKEDKNWRRRYQQLSGRS